MKLDKVRQARKHLDLAIVSLRAGMNSQALDHLNQVLTISPDSAQARLVEAQAHLGCSQPQQALTALDAHDHYHPHPQDESQLALLRAQALAVNGQHDMAQRLVQRFIETYPDDVRGYRIGAGSALATGRSETAISLLKNVVRLEPSDKASGRVLAMLVANKDPQTAIDLLMADPELQTDPAQKLGLARLLQQVGRIREAGDVYASLLEEHPDQAELWSEAALLSDAMGEMAQAVAQLTRALELGDNNEVIAMLALVHMHSGDFQHAAEKWWMLSRRDPSRLQALAGLIVCALADDQPDVAMRVASMLDKRSSANERRKLLGELWLHASVGKTIVMVTADRSMSLTSGTENQSPSPLAKILAASRQTLDEHASTHPHRADANYHRAVIARAQGDTLIAQNSVNQALQINPRYVAAQRLDEMLRNAA